MVIDNEDSDDDQIDGDGNDTSSSLNVMNQNETVEETCAQHGSTIGSGDEKNSQFLSSAVRKPNSAGIITLVELYLSLNLCFIHFKFLKRL